MNESFRRGLIPPLNSKILESFTFTRPGFRVNLTNLDELEQFFRIITGLDTKHLEGFIYLQPYLANFTNSEKLLQRQMNIVFELGYTTLNYMQRSFQIMEKEIQLLLEMAQYKSENN